MNKKFEARFSRLQDLLKEYEEAFIGLTYEQANVKPSDGGWSMAEVVYHMSHAEKTIIQYIQKKLINPTESKPAGLKAWYKAAFLRFALRSKRKFRAPKMLDEPKGPYEPVALFSEWKIIRATLNQTINAVSSADANRLLFKHPVVGKINIYQTLGFMGDHMKRHLEQLNNIKKEL